MLDTYARDIPVLRTEIGRLNALLADRNPLSERDDLLPLFRASPHLAAAFGAANTTIAAPDLLAVEKQLFGAFRCDITVGESQSGQFALVELEDATPTSIFEPVRGRAFPRWSSRFERGFSQLVDWAWRIDHERQPSAALEAVFGTADPHIHYVLVIGRNHWIDASARARLNWRRTHNGISGQRTTIWTYDDLLASAQRRLTLAELDASALASDSSSTQGHPPSSRY